MRLGLKVGPLLALALLALLAALGSGEGALSANVAATRWLQAVAPPSLAEPLTASLLLGSTSVSLALVAGLSALLYYRGHALAALSLGVILLGLGVELALKSWLSHPAIWAEFYRQAPWYPVPQLSPGLELPSPFPSGHTMRTTFLALTASNLASRRLGPPLARLIEVAAWLLVVCAGGSVVYLGWHWTTDALGGISLGYALAVATAYVSRRQQAG